MLHSVQTHSAMNRATILIAAAALAAAAGYAARSGKTVTFSEQIAPIIFNNCTTCHRPGEAAPFPLMSYADARKRGPLIAAVTKSRYMPPWHAAHGFGEFQDERRLSDEQIADIAQWVKDGMPQGDPAKLPALPKFTEGWHLGKPDLIVAMPKGFPVPASGPDVYRNFVVPLNLTEDKWVRAIEFRPGTRAVVHHCLFSYDATGTLRKREGADGKPGFGGMGAGRPRIGGGGGRLGGWAVGATPVPLAEGLAYPLPKGSDLILQEHFHLTGKPETEVSTVGIYFANNAPERALLGIQVPPVFGIGSGLHIAAGEKSYTIKDSATVPVDLRVYSAGAHAHYLAKDMKMVAVLPGGRTQPLLWIPDWDFAWQDRYRLKEPIVLPKGTRIDVSITYDNSVENPHQPSHPPKDVWWGEGSFDEMGSMGVQGVCVRKEDEPILREAMRASATRAFASAMKNGTLLRLGLRR